MFLHLDYRNEDDLYFKNHLHFLNPTGKTHILKPLKVAFFPKNCFVLFFVLSRDPNEQLCKYQHIKQKTNLLSKNHKIAFFTFFEGPRKWAL